MRIKLRGLVILLALSPLVPAWQAAGADVRVVYWYDRGRPLETFKFQAYDLRKKEFTPGVESWLSLIKTKHPRYEAYARDVDLSREKGGTDKLKIGSAITREFLTVGSHYGYTFGSYGLPPGGPPPSAQPPRWNPIPRVGGPALGIAPPSLPFPVPYPYPRPHP